MGVMYPGYKRNFRWQGEFFVYEVSDGERVRYVGMAKNPYARMLKHLAGGDLFPKPRETRIHRWLSASVRAGRPFSFSVVALHPDYDSAHADEVRRIRQHARVGPMLNGNCWKRAKACA